MEINKELMNKHWAEMKKLFDEQVKQESDKEKAKERLEQLTKNEMQWLKEHPGYPRFFSPLNDIVNPVTFVFPDAKKIPCSNCIFSKNDSPTNAFCKVYRDPNMKPKNVLWGKNARCEYRVTKKQAEKAKKNKDEKEKK